MKWVFQTKEDFNKIFSELVKNELMRFDTRADKLHTVNIEKTQLTVFTVAFCSAHAEKSLIKFKIPITDQCS